MPGMITVVIGGETWPRERMRFLCMCVSLFSFFACFDQPD